MKIEIFQLKVFELKKKCYIIIIFKVLYNDIAFHTLFPPYCTLKGEADYSLRALFTKFLTPSLSNEFCNPLDDWLDWLIPTNHQADYKIRRLTQELKSW